MKIMRKKIILSRLIYIHHCPTAPDHPAREQAPLRLKRPYAENQPAYATAVS